MSSAVQPLNFLSGVEALGNAHDGWQLDRTPREEEERSFSAAVVFRTPFAAPPLIHLGVVGFDISNHDAARLAVRAAAVTETGFEIRLSTWLHSKLWCVDVSWLAIGA